MAEGQGPRAVLMTADTVGGVFPYALLLAERLLARGLRVVLATMGAEPRPAQREAVRRVAGLELRESTYALEWMDDPWDDVAAAGAWLLELERELRPDVVHLNGYAHAALAWRAPTVVVAHSCVASWWRAALGEAAPARYARYRREVARGVRAAGAVVAPTRAMLAEVRELHGEPRRAVVISNAARAPSPRPADARRAHAEPLVLAAGRVWDEAKDLALVDAVAPRLGWPVVIAGSDVHPDGARRPLRHARALGWLDAEALGGWMRRAAVFVHPARYEPFGLAPLEAALHGCALVLGDIPSLREVWGDAALFVPAGDAGALAGAIERLRADPRLREALAARALARATRFSPDRQVDAYLALYTSLVSPTTSTSAPDLHPCA